MANVTLRNWYGWAFADSFYAINISGMSRGLWTAPRPTTLIWISFLNFLCEQTLEIELSECLFSLDLCPCHHTKKIARDDTHTHTHKTAKIPSLIHDCLVCAQSDLMHKKKPFFFINFIWATAENHIRITVAMARTMRIHTAVCRNHCPHHPTTSDSLAQICLKYFVGFQIFLHRPRRNVWTEPTSEGLKLLELCKQELFWSIPNQRKEITENLMLPAHLAACSNMPCSNKWTVYPHSTPSLAETKSCVWENNHLDAWSAIKRHENIEMSRKIRSPWTAKSWNNHSFFGSQWYHPGDKIRARIDVSQAIYNLSEWSNDKDFRHNAAHKPRVWQQPGSMGNGTLRCHVWGIDQKSLLRLLTFTPLYCFFPSTKSTCQTSCYAFRTFLHKNIFLLKWPLRMLFESVHESLMQNGENTAVFVFRSRCELFATVVNRWYTLTMQMTT